jgi:hypothetical protein
VESNRIVRPHRDAIEQSARLRTLRGTAARDLLVPYIESLELLDAVEPLGIKII